eukprot:5740887-Pyramimonas_sp.AAC.1
MSTADYARARQTTGGRGITQEQGRPLEHNRPQRSTADHTGHGRHHGSTAVHTRARQTPHEHGR